MIGRGPAVVLQLLIVAVCMLVFGAVGAGAQTPGAGRAGMSGGVAHAEGVGNWGPHFPGRADIDCAKPFFVGVRGSGEIPQVPGDPAVYVYAPGRYADEGMGSRVGAVFDAVAARHPHGMNVFGVAYPAVPVEIWRGVDYLDDYAASVQDGAAHLTAVIETIDRACSSADPQIMLAGYSQGANVINVVLAGLQERHPGALRSVASVFLTGNPNRVAFTPGAMGAAGDSACEGVVPLVNGTGRLGGDPVCAALVNVRLLTDSWGTIDPDMSGFIAAHPGVWHSYCLAGDAICNFDGRLLVAADIHESYATARGYCPAVGGVVAVGECGARVLSARVAWPGR